MCYAKHYSKLIIQDGNTPLMWAASSGFIRVIEELLSSGAKVNQVNKVRAH